MGHFLSNARAHSGEDHGALPPGENADQAVRQSRCVFQPLEKGLKIGVVADLAVPLEVAALLFGLSVGPADLAGIGDVLNLRIVWGNRDIPVNGGIFAAGHRIGCAENIRHS